MPITGGIVSFEQSRKLAEYENRKVSITFNVNESEGNSATEQVIGALALAQHHTFVALGLAKATDTPAAASIGAAEPEKGKPGRKKPPAVVTVDPPRPGADPAAVTDDAAVVSDTPTQRGGANTASATATSPDPAAVTDDSLFSPAAEVATVTDAELLSQITRKNAALQVQIGDQAPPKIRALIGKYVTAPKQAKDIPQDQRAKFLEELAAITA